jgi:hypothetical protein
VTVLALTTTDVAQLSAAAATALLALLTFLYVKATRSMVDELRETRLAQQQPYVILEFDNPRSIICDMVIKNIGNGPAFDVKVEFDPDPPYRETDLRLSQLPLFQQLKFFAPDREFRFFYKTLVGDDSGPNASDAEIVASVSYADLANRHHSHQIALSPYLRWHLSQIEEKTLDDVVKKLDDIANGLSKVERRVQEFDYRFTKDVEASVPPPTTVSRDELQARLTEVIALWEAIYGYDIHAGHTFLQARLRRCALELLQQSTGLSARGELSDPAPIYELVRRLLKAANSTMLMGDGGKAFHDAGKEIVELAKAEADDV